MKKTTLLLAVFVLIAGTAGADGLPSWNEGPVKAALLGWLAAVTDPAGPDFIPEPERVAVFDNDGTSACERPRSLASRCQKDLLAGRAARGEIDGGAMPVRAWLADDRDALGEYGWREAYRGLNAAFAGLEVTAFADSVRAWVGRNRHPRFDAPYTDLYYTPMAELRKLLEDNGFQVWIVTGSPQSVIRAVSEQAAGVPPERVIGTTSLVEYEVTEEGVGRVVRSADQVANTYERKPANIETRIGRRPVFAAGNSNNDEPMSRYAVTGSRRGFVLWIHHDDDDREYAYDRGTDRIRRLVAEEKDAHEVSVRNDWRRVFPFETE